MVSRTSAFAFKGKEQDIRAIGKQLNVSHALEGSVRKAGNRLRIAAQLINVEDGFQLWSEKYDRELDDVFAIQDDIAVAIVKKLKMKLTGEQESQLVKRYTKNLEAYHLYLQGRFHLNKRTEEGLKKGMTFCEQAIALDSTYALAYAGLADGFALLGFQGFCCTSASKSSRIFCASSRFPQLAAGGEIWYAAQESGVAKMMSVLTFIAKMLNIFNDEHRQYSR
ncbi:hypothetical protein L0337_42985 [candidate division KSB1 bacterium]|nr:hypothetical protein [candidate division KSB1 bacterium]